MQLARDALARLEEIRPEPLVSLAQLKRTLASILAGRSEFLEAERLAREALEIDRKLFGPDSSYALQDLLALGETLSQAGRAGEAELAERDAVAIAERVSVERDLLRARAYRLLATMTGQHDASAESEALQQAIETSRRFVGDRPEVGSSAGSVRGQIPARL